MTKSYSDAPAEFKYKGLTIGQTSYLAHLRSKNSLVVVTGPAGSGKSFLATKLASYLLKSGQVERLVLSRPTVPTGKSIGFFPGSLIEKMEPWVQPLISLVSQDFGEGFVETAIKNGRIEIVPFEVVRGRTFDNSFVILDEAQNATYEEVKALVTRIGSHCKMVINGDTTQTDLRPNGYWSSKTNGLSHLVNLVLSSEKLRELVSVVELGEEDIVRSPMCKALVLAYQEYEDNLSV